MKKYPASTLLLIALAASLPALKAQGVLVNEGFESFTSGAVLSGAAQNGWFANTSGNPALGAVKISDASAHGGSNSLYLLDGLAGYSPAATLVLAETIDAGHLDFWFRRDAAYTEVNYRVEFRPATGTDGDNFRLFIGTVGGVSGFHVTTSNGVAVVASVRFTDLSQSDTFSLTNWNNLRLSFDKGAQSVSLTLNGVTELVLTGAQVGEIANLEAGRFTFYAGYGSTTNVALYLDDIQVGLAPVPEPGAFAALAGLAALGAALLPRRRRAG